jgi:hypothetical protein
MRQTRYLSPQKLMVALRVLDTVEVMKTLLLVTIISLEPLSKIIPACHPNNIRVEVIHVVKTV